MSNANETVFTFDVGGMTCSACSTRIEKLLNRLPGVTDATVNLAMERADVRVVGDEVDEALLEETLTNAGFSAHFRDDSEAAEAAHRAAEERALEREWLTLCISGALTLPLVIQMIFMATGSDLHLPPLAEFILATPVQFVIGARFYRSAWQTLRAGSGNMDVLVAMGTTTAYLYSWYLLITLKQDAVGQLYFEASAVIITLVLLGKYMESRAKRGTTAAIRQLMELRPTTARVLRDGTETEVPVARVRSGDIGVVRPGENVPVDGVVREGNSEIDESLITGESIPVDKTPGDRVTGGSVNGTGMLQVEATAVGADSTLSKIIRLVENAQAGKAPIQRLVDRISAIFVPAVVMIASLTFGGWYFMGGELEPALIAAVSVLVIACPCALGLATPTAIMTGTGAAARAGILIKDVEALEQAHAINTVIFDKTGTLTEGHPAVTDVHAVDGNSDELLRLVASLQQGSEHPLAKAMLDAATDMTLSPVDHFRSHTGFGVEGMVDGSLVRAGNRRFMADNGIAIADETARIEAWEHDGRTVILVAKNDGVIGTIALFDSLRPQAAAAVNALRSMGVATLLLSGDAERVVATTAREVGIDKARGAVLPADKSTAVAEQRAAGRTVGMIGDGINDAPALAAANVGIAMGSGTDVAMETAAVTLMRPDPSLVPAAISVSRATWRKIKQNLFWAFIYNIIGIPLAMAGLLSPTIAGAAMAFSSVSVASNSLLLRNWRPNNSVKES